MKLKGINVWEQHVEKIVFAGAVLVFLVLTAYQLLTNPNAQFIPGRGTLNPGQIDEFLREKAETLLAQMGPEAAISGEIPKHEPLLQEFKSRLNDPVSPEKMLAQLRYDIRLNIEGVGPAGRPYFVPQPEAPDPIVVAQCANALSPQEVQKFEALAAMFPAGAEPFDLAWTTIAFRWDKADFIDQLQGKGLTAAPGDPLAVPTPWHRNMAWIIDTVVEREEQVGDMWTNSTVLPPIPGRATFRPLLIGPVAGKDRDDLLRKLGDGAMQTEILRPAFYATKTEPCPPPDLDFGPGQRQPGDDPVGTLKKSIAQAKDELTKLEAQLVELGGPVEPKEPGKPPGTGKGKGGEGAGGGGTSGGGGIGAGGPPGKSTAGGDDKGAASSPAGIAKRKAKMVQIEKKKAELAKLDAELAKSAANPAEGGPKPATAEVSGLVDLWTYDITAQPGKIYRYRATVKVYNPFFGHRANLVPEQQHLADELVLTSPPSQWSQPVRVTPWLRHFVTAATAPNPDRLLIGGSGLGQLGVEVFRFFDGRWHQEKFSVGPGDRIGGKKTTGGRDGQPQVQIDFSTDWFVVDILEDVSPDSEGGRSAKAVLQAFGSRQVQCRDPRVDNADPDFKWLKSQVEQVRVAHQ